MIVGEEFPEKLGLQVFGDLKVLKLSGISSSHGGVPKRQARAPPSEPGARLLEMFAELVDSRMESCERISRLVQQSHSSRREREREYADGYYEPARYAPEREREGYAYDRRETLPPPPPPSRSPGPYARGYARDERAPPRY